MNLKPKDVVRINGKYETVVDVDYNVADFTVFWSNCYEIDDIDKDENGNPIILIYGEDVDVGSKEQFIGYFPEIRKDYPFHTVDGHYREARPIQEKKEVEPVHTSIEDIDISIKNINKRLGEIENKLGKASKLIHERIYNLVKRVDDLEG